MLTSCVCFFLFKQKTAYEMRISDWSSDVCSSDLLDPEDVRQLARHLGLADAGRPGEQIAADRLLRLPQPGTGKLDRGRQRGDGGILPEHHRLEVALQVGEHGLVVEIGRASCRERVCQYV